MLAGAFLVYFTTTGALLSSIAIGIGNTFEGLVAATLVERLADGTEVFRRIRTVFRFAFIAMFSTSIGATWKRRACAARVGRLDRLQQHLDDVVAGRSQRHARRDALHAALGHDADRTGEAARSDRAAGLLVLLVCVGLVVFGGLFRRT